MVNVYVEVNKNACCKHWVIWLNVYVEVNKNACCKHWVIWLNVYVEVDKNACLNYRGNQTKCLASWTKHYWITWT